MPAILLLRDSVNANGDTAAKVREWSSVIGIVTAIVGNILISFALNIQRYAHVRLRGEKEGHGSHAKATARDYGIEQEDIAEERAKANLDSTFDENSKPDRNGHHRHGSRTSRTFSFGSESSSQSTVKPLRGKDTHEQDTRSYLSSPYWWAGIIMMTIGEGGNFLAYGFAPASIVSPLGVVALVSNCIIAPCLLKERFRQRDFWGVLVAIAGAVVVVLSAKTSETKMGPHDIWAAITRWEFELYLGITAGLIIILLWASGKYGQKSILIDLGLVGLFGGYTALSTKGVASLLSDTLWRTLTFPITYLLLVVLIGSAVLQIRYVNRALQRFDSTQVIPIQFVLFTISVIIGSAVLYRDFKSATAERVGKFIGGCLLTFLGVYLITSGRSRGDSNEDDHLDDEEEAIGMVDEERLEDEAEASPEDEAYADDTTPTPKSSRRSSRSAFSARSTPHTPLRNHSLPSPHTPPTTSNPSNNNNDSETYYTPPTRPRPQTRPQNTLNPTISTPLLPSDAHRSGTSTPTRSERPSTLTRNSMAHLKPGPFTSPLSSSLAAIVADSIRRGEHDSPSAAAARRRPQLDGLRKSRSQRGNAESTSAAGARRAGGRLSMVEGMDLEGNQRERGGSPLKNVRSQRDETHERNVRPGNGERGQSISAALGEFLKLKFKREGRGGGGGGGSRGRGGGGGGNDDDDTEEESGRGGEEARRRESR